MNGGILIIGGGPAGLTAALELQRGGASDVTVVEADGQVGGISRTVNHHGNRIDIGGHRFFSKSDWVMKWWTDILPLAREVSERPLDLRHRGQTREWLGATTVRTEDDAARMLVRNRLSRIYFNRQFFDYPLRLNLPTLRKLGVCRTVGFGWSYARAQLGPVTPELTLEDFLVNRFGARLYKQFFKEYTEKVWGVPCNEISAAWGAQRIKSLSVSKALLHALRGAVGLNGAKDQQTSLIERFLYPTYGPGQIWEEVAKRFVSGGGKLILGHRVVALDIKERQVRGVTIADGSGRRETLSCDFAISTMPIKDLVLASRQSWTPAAVDIAANLEYRDFITVGLLYSAADLPRRLEDNWIYIQEPGVQVGRVQVFNNWSPHMVADPGTVWLGLEYFCKEGDMIWSESDQELQELAQEEMKRIGLVSATRAHDAVTIRVPKAYPGYFGHAYSSFHLLRSELDAVGNLHLIGRNGMHRYNNQDHSMLTGKEAAMQILSGNVAKERIWDINVGDEYHEEMSSHNRESDTGLAEERAWGARKRSEAFS